MLRCMSFNAISIVMAVGHQVHKDVSLVREDPDCKGFTMKTRMCWRGDERYNIHRHMQHIKAGPDTLPLAV